MDKPDGVTELGRLPLVEEVPRLLRRRIMRRVRVAVTTGEENDALEAVLQHRRAEIERVPLGHEVETVPPVRQEGDVLIIPVVEERAVVVRRLVLMEEIRLRLRTEDETVSLPVSLRRQTVAVERMAAGEEVQTRVISGGYSMAQHTMIAMFDSRAQAERAAEALRGLNVQASGIAVQDTDGDWLPEEERSTWQEAFRRGGALVRAEVAEDDMELAMDAMEAAGAVDVDERAATWRREGWTGGSAAGMATGTTATSTTATGVSATGAMATGGSTASRTEQATTGRLEGGAERIQLGEERLRVGKRMAQSGRVRVRTYTVETPVEEQVRLREEHVHVERHAVDRAATGGEELFRDRVIEAEESSEEAVVSKETRVTGEVVVNKETTERTETIRDTVRRTEVEVNEDAANDPARRGSKGAA